MAIITRYFDDTGAGTQAGTSWANRAVLFPGGVWSTVITDFDFTGGSDSLLCLVNGSHSISSVLNAAAFSSGVPTFANPLLIHGCDNTGAKLVPSNPDWMSPQGYFDDTLYPTFSTGYTGDIATVNAIFWRCCKFINSAHDGPLFGGKQYFDWCGMTVTNEDTAAGGWSKSVGAITNSQVRTSVSAYAYLVALEGSGTLNNVRIVGVTGSSGNRHGIAWSGAEGALVRNCTIIGVGGGGIYHTEDIGHGLQVINCTIANCGGNGITFNTNVSPRSTTSVINKVLVTGCGGWGFDGSSTNANWVINSRWRDNASGNITGTGNWTPFDNDQTDSNDATEYVSPGSGDYRVKFGSDIWPLRYGAGRQEEGAAGGLLVHPGIAGGMRG